MFITGWNWWTQFLLAYCSVPTLTNGTVTSSEDCPDGQCELNTTVSLSCDPEYYHSGSDQSTCVGANLWDPPIPTCEGK